MKYFSINYWSNWDKEDEIGKEYRSYIASVRPQLPMSIQMLTAGGGDISLNDGSISNLDVSIENATVSIIFNGKWINNTLVGLRIFHLSYTGVTKLLSIIDHDADGFSECGYGDHGFDEIEIVDDKLYEHRMLFSSGIELHVRFQDFSMTYKDVPNTVLNIT